MVFLALPRSPEPHVLLVRVCGQEQLLPADQSRVHHQPGPSLLLLLHRPLHRHGEPTPDSVAETLLQRQQMTCAVLGCVCSSEHSL